MDEQPTMEVDVDTIEVPSERRTSRRTALRVPVKVQSLTEFRGESRDISAGGIFVAMDEDLPVGSLIDVEFRLPGISRAFSVLGEIRWVRSDEQSRQADLAGIGVEFLDLPSNGQDVVGEMVDTFSTVYDTIGEEAPAVV